MNQTRMTVAYRGGVTALLEAGPVDPTKNGHYRIKIIQPGKGSSGVYLAENLAASASLFRAGTQMYCDHPSLTEESDRPERSVKDLAGKLVTDAAVGEDGALYAECEVYPSFDKIIREKWSDIGVSINAWCDSVIGSDGVVPPFDGVVSVDFVTKAGAGGALLEVLESERIPTQKENSMNPDEFKQILNEAIAPVMSALEELKAKKSEDKPEDKPSDSPVPPKAREAEEAAEPEEDDEEKKKKLESAIVAGRKIAESGLPEAARDRVVKVVESGGDVTEAIESERKYIESVASTTVGQVRESDSADAPYQPVNFK